MTFDDFPNIPRTRTRGDFPNNTLRRENRWVFLACFQSARLQLPREGSKEEDFSRKLASSPTHRGFILPTGLLICHWQKAASTRYPDRLNKARN
jgi:hypothetical protein